MMRFSMRWKLIVVFLVISYSPLPVSAQPAKSLLYGFTAFPYDLTMEALDKVHEIILPHSNLYAIHFDRCLPWHESLADKPLPEWLAKDWQDIKSRIPKTHSIYVAVTPTANDRQSLAPSCGESEDKEKRPPFLAARFNHPDVKRAYANYVKRVVEFFQPRYLNIGVEISELALRQPDAWADFEALFIHTYNEIKAQHPTVQIGAEFVLQSLMTPKVAAQVKPVVDQGDYLGLSFYPYGSQFGVKFGAIPLPDGNDQWRKPLAWVRNYSSKPLAICETGYLTQPLDVAKFDLKFPGSEQLQTEFLKDLLKTAKEERYAFLVWFIAVDYDRLYDKMPRGSEWALLWMHAGLFDKDLKPKPAWAAWMEFSRANP